MNEHRETALALPDMEDGPPRVCRIEEEQVEYLVERIGWVKFAWLQDMEDENARNKV